MSDNKLLNDFIMERIKKRPQPFFRKIEEIKEFITPELYSFLEEFYSLSSQQQNYIKDTISTLKKHNL